jgi:hypothetical protein
MTRRILLVALLLTSSFTFAQVYGTGTAWPYGASFGPILTPPIAQLPAPGDFAGTITYGPVSSSPPLVSAPVVNLGWTSTYTGASNSTSGNEVGARNSTVAGLIYGSEYVSSAGIREGFLRVTAGPFNTGAAFYTSTSFGDRRSLGEVAAGLRKQTKTTARVYTNDDISRLRQPQAGSTLAPQTVKPSKK